jgi:drug/metabolite transporter (DMT)-like permease
MPPFNPMPNLKTELPLLALLALLWGSSYLFIKVAVEEIPPITLMAVRVTGAAIFLLTIMKLSSTALPNRLKDWRMLFVLAILNSIGAWTVLAWGLQYVDSALASVLNSTSPIFVFLFTFLFTRHEVLNARKMAGALLGMAGVALIVGIDALSGLGSQVAGQIACLAGSIFYACAAIYGKRFGHLGALATAAGTMILASVVLIPAALFFEHPWTLRPSIQSMAAVATLSILCTGVALLIYFRLIQTLGSMGVASQAYLRAGVGVMLGIIFLGETLSLPIALGLVAALTGVALINWPVRSGKR